MSSHFNTKNIEILLEKAKNSEIYSIIGFGSRVQYKNPEEIKKIVENIYNQIGGYVNRNPVFIYNGDPSNDGSIGIAYAYLSKLMIEYGGFLIMSQIDEAESWGIDKMMYVQEPVLYVPTPINRPNQCKYGGINWDNMPIGNTKSIVEINELRCQRNENPINKIFVIGDKLYEDDIIPWVSVIAHFERKIFNDLNIPVENIFAEAKNKDILISVQNEINNIETSLL